MDVKKPSLRYLAQIMADIIGGDQGLEVVVDVIEREEERSA